MTLLRLAEAATTYEPLKPGEDLVVTDGYILFFGLGQHAAERLRLTPDSFASTVDEVRGLVRERGGSDLTWKVTSIATPPDLAERLLALGAIPAAEPEAAAMALRESPGPLPAGVAVSRVETVDDFRTFVSITHDVFGIGERLEQELERIGRQGERDLADRRYVRYLAWIDGEPVAAASATFTESGAILHAGSTKVEARGRGAYRALVAARWQDAAARGAPALVTWAGAMSRPILERLGFEEVGRLRILRDEL